MTQFWANAVVFTFGMTIGAIMIAAVGHWWVGVAFGLLWGTVWMPLSRQLQHRTRRGEDSAR